MGAAAFRNAAHGPHCRAMLDRSLNMPPLFARSDEVPVEWATSEGLVGYDEAVRIMEDRAAAIAEGRAPELVWLLGIRRSTPPACRPNPSTGWRRSGFRCT